MCDLEPYTLVKHIMGIVGVTDASPAAAAAGGKSPSASAVAASPARSASNTYGGLSGLDLFTLSYSVRLAVTQPNILCLLRPSFVIPVFEALDFTDLTLF